MRKSLAAIVGGTALLATAVLGVSNSSAGQPPASSPVATPASATTQAPGPFCVDYLSKQVGADGNSIKVASACSDQSIEVARTLARTAATRKIAQTQGSAVALAETKLISLYINYNQSSLQREIYGTAGGCDGAGYTFAAYSADVGRMSSSRGWNGCNAVRLRNVQNQYSYLFQPANWGSGFNDNTNQYHPYCANPSTGQPC